MTDFSEVTLPGSPLVQAPGKVFLVGEYAVLDGGTAMLASVSRHALGQYLPGAKPASPVVAETHKAACDRLVGLAEALPPGAVLVDTGQFSHGGKKLGLGSSAAVAVAVAGTLLESVGLDVHKHRTELFDIADVGHRTAQGGVGSGADVAVAVHGGYLRFTRAGIGRPRIEGLTPPRALVIKVLASGQPASTTSMVKRVRAFASARPEAHAAFMLDLKRLADAFAHAFAQADASEVVAAAAQYGEALQALGEAASTPIVPPAFAAAAARASEVGGAAKPSGAGGGDVGVAFFTSEDAAEAFAASCPQGLRVLDLGLGGPGALRKSLSFGPAVFQDFKKD